MNWLIWLLIFILVIVAIGIRVRRAVRVVIFKNASQQSSSNGNPRVKGFRTTNIEQMVSCSKCGIYIPASEALFRSGKVYCSEDHMDS